MAIQLVQPVKEPDKDMVEMAEEFLAHVKSGRVIMLAVAAVERDGSTFSGYSKATGKNLASLIGAVEYVKMRIVRKHDEAE